MFNLNSFKESQIKSNPLLVTKPESSSLSIFPWAIGEEKKTKNKAKKAQLVLDREEIDSTIEGGDPSYIFHILSNRIITKEDGKLFSEAIRKLLQSKHTDSDDFFNFTERLIQSEAIELDDVINESIKMDEEAAAKEVEKVNLEEEPEEDPSRWEPAQNTNPQSFATSDLNKFNLRQSQALLDKANVESIVEQGDPQSIFSLLRNDVIGREDQNLFDRALEKLINSADMFSRGALMFLVDKGKIELREILERL